jgi:hypothetical protein
MVDRLVRVILARNTLLNSGMIYPFVAVFSSLIFSALADWHAISALPLWQKTRPTNPPIQGYYSTLPSGQIGMPFLPCHSGRNPD